MVRYVAEMMDGPAIPAPAESPSEVLDAVLRHDLSQGDAALSSMVPILRHLLEGNGNGVFSDEIVACVRGMIADLSRQLLDEMAKAQGEADWRTHQACSADELKAALSESPALLRHLHALALEQQMATRLQSRLALDPVLPPCLQSQIASADPESSAAAMNLLASQSRFRQAQQRMKLPLAELPGDLLHGALLAMRTVAGTGAAGESAAAAADGAIRLSYDEAKSRLGLLSRTVIGMGGSGMAALSLETAGLAIFLTALSLASGQDRDVCVLATSESQVARLALSLGATGLRAASVSEQFLALHPDMSLPEGIDRLGPDRAAAILAAAGF
jgi:hypothetical protein